MEEIGFKPPPEDEWPPLYEDLPYEAQEAMRLFYSLPPKVDGMAGYLGRDLSCLDMMFNVYDVPIASRATILNILLYLISRSVKSESDKIQQENNKRDSKSNG